MEITWAQVANSLLPLLGVAVGGAATYITQNNLFKKEMKREKEKEKSAMIIEKLAIYSKVLEKDGECSMYNYSAISGYAEFNVSQYQTEIRPILYSKFYCLDYDVAGLVRKMDVTLSERDLIGGLGERSNTSLIKSYDQIIMSIQKELTHS